MRMVSRAVAVGVAVGLVAFAAVNLSPAGAQGPLLGQRLADSLGLKPETSNPVIGCNYLAMVDGDAYCLDGHVSNGVEFREMAMRLRGQEPTAADTRSFELLVEAYRLSETMDISGADQERLDEVMKRLRAYWETQPWWVG